MILFTKITTFLYNVLNFSVFLPYYIIERNEKIKGHATCRSYEWNDNNLPHAKRFVLNGYIKDDSYYKDDSRNYLWQTCFRY